MATRLPDKQEKGIIADRADGQSIRSLASKYGVSTTTVQRVLKRNPEVTQKVTQKKEQNTADILAYMGSKSDLVCEIIGKGLDVLASDDKLAEASPSQITTALGTLIDKWTALNLVSKDQEKAASKLFSALEKEESE
ncbi:MAG: helix-turn-helix domain-containing protein [Clostridiales bacterium]|nr:helix-turn-helix domain-containing protein [Clostridiales bacterium]